MKPLPDFFEYHTNDLTQGYLHRADDGTVFIRFPKTYEEVTKAPGLAAGTKDQTKIMRIFRVTSWDIYTLPATKVEQ